MSAVPRLVSLRVGVARTHGVPGAGDPMERAWTSAYVKDEASGPLRLSWTQLAGDQQYDTASHGGPHMAVLAYAASHYPFWREELAEPAMGPGGFGENFTLSELDEVAVSIGDSFSVGTARVQVSQPRGPCANISRRWKRPELLRRVTETGYTGWYLRVLEPGTVRAGDELRWLERPFAEWTVARVFRLRLEPDADPAAVHALADCEALSPEWRMRFAKLRTG
jgi:MOSC domain-containing protein YiiM